MQKKTDGNIRTRQTYLNISIVFIVLIITLQVLVWLYWERILEPRLLRETTSQANVLAHSQAIKLEDAMSETNSEKRFQTIGEAIDEILLFTDPESDAPYFLGLEIEVDYEVISAPLGSLDITRGTTHCQNCFLSKVALFSPISDELIGIARFNVSDSFARRLVKDVRRTLFGQSYLGAFLLLLVWGVVMFLIKEVNRSRQQAEIANRSKSAFLANMSHELRTPLNAIIGFSELMRHDPDFLPKYRENLSIINRSGEYLLELINDVLELSKIEAVQNTLTETSFDLYEILENIAEMIRLRAEKKNLQLVVDRAKDVPRYINTDERKLRQILLNLLGNAVKFTEEGGVTLRVRQKDGNGNDMDKASLTLHFEVEDSGPGIAPKEMTKMFDAFTQTQSGHDKKEGTGLGLAISRQFVNHLGGQISANSTVGKGTVFGFTIQVKPSIDSELKSYRPERKVTGMNFRDGGDPDHPHRILVVDDHPENRALLRMLLEQIGFSVKCAENGLQAVELNKKWEPHLIWMDMRMPVMDGYEATKTIRQAKGGKPEGQGQPIIIALTASAFNEDREAVLSAGCDDFVRRPFREAEILDKIQEHLGVEYIYETVAEVPKAKAESHAFSDESLRWEIMGLPGNVVEELKTAIELSDMERMDQIIAKIPNAHDALGHELKKLVDTFQYDRLLTLLNK